MAIALGGSGVGSHGAKGRGRACKGVSLSAARVDTLLGTLLRLCAPSHGLKRCQELILLCTVLAQETVKVVMRCRPLFGREIEVRDDHAYPLCHLQ